MKACVKTTRKRREKLIDRSLQYILKVSFRYKAGVNGFIVCEICCKQKIFLKRKILLHFMS